MYSCAVVAADRASAAAVLAMVAYWTRRWRPPWANGGRRDRLPSSGPPPCEAKLEDPGASDRQCHPVHRSRLVDPLPPLLPWQLLALATCIAGAYRAGSLVGRSPWTGDAAGAWDPPGHNPGRGEWVMSVGTAFAVDLAR